MFKFRKHHYTCRPIPHAAAVAFIAEHHYSKGAGALSSVRIGLFRKSSGELVGVSLWMMASAGACKRYKVGGAELLALSRLAIAPEVPTNGASFLIGWSIRYIRKTRKEIKALVTYADGMQKHTGAIYRASNWTFDGDTGKTYRWKDADGRLRSCLAHRVAYMDQHFTRVGPYSKKRFVYWL